MPEIHVRLLTETDDRSGFSSGHPELDRFFRQYAGQNQFRHHIGSTYVAVVSAEILGFATVAPCSIEVEALPARLVRRLPTYPLPVLRLARLATDERARGMGVGRLLLRCVFELAREMSDRLGCVGVVVDAKPGVEAFYERYGFQAFEVIEGARGERPPPTPMFLPLGKIPRRP